MKSLGKATNVEELYRRLEDSTYIKQCIKYAQWTIPSAFPRRFDTIRNNAQQNIKHDYQSMGATLTNFLSAKLTGLLFPVNQPFFRISANDKVLKVLGQLVNKSEQELLEYFAKLESDACKELYVDGAYAQLVQAIRYLIITGNCLIKRIDGVLTIYSLHNFVLRRNNEGQVLDIVLKEHWSYDSLPLDLQSLTKDKNPEDEATVFTHVKRVLKNKKTGTYVWEVVQELDGKPVGEKVTYQDKLCPYFAVTWNMVNGDSYGRGMIEDYAGDFAKLSALSLGLAKYEMASTRIINLVAPGAATDVDTLAEAEDNGWVQGNPAEIQPYEVGVYQKIKQLSDELQVIYQRLALAFMYQGNTRDAERVTGYEIQQNAIEAEKALGGVYSQLSAGLHLPLSVLLSHDVDPVIVEGILQGQLGIDVLTGVAALGRSSDVQNLLTAIQELAAIIPAMMQISPRFDTDSVINTVLLAHNVPLDSVLLDDEELQNKMDAGNAAAEAGGMGAGLGDSLTALQQAM
jgi:hypothetical protein